VQDRLRAGLLVDGLALVGAFWCRYCYGETERGAPIAPNDAAWNRLQASARAARTRPDARLEMRDIVGESGAHPCYAMAFRSALDAVWKQGTRAAMLRYVAGEALA